MIEMGTIWDRTTAFIAEHLRAILPIALFALLLPITAAIVIAGAGEGCSPAIDPLVAGIAAVVLVLPTIWAQLALVGLVLAPEGQRGGASRAATGAFGRAVAAMLLLFVAIIVLSLPIVIASTAGGMPMMHGGCAATVDGYGSIGWFVPLYGIALAIVVAVIALRMTMLYPVVLAEGGVIAAIRRAWALSRGLFWKLVGVWLVFGLVYGVAWLAAKTAFGAVLGLIVPHAGPFGVTTIIAALLVACVRVAFTVIVATFAAMLYRAAAGAGGARPAA